jgi:DNA helicase HerA-like ATPase
MAEPLVFAKSSVEIAILPRMANRHGLVAGATGTGKTVTLQSMAEHFSRIGVPVFMADVKGDLSGVSQAGGGNQRVEDRIKQLEIKDFEYAGSSVVFWDVFGQQGHPLRATISEMGPLLFSRLLNLNDTQSGVLQLAYKFADDNGLLLLDLKDLRALLQFIGENTKTFKTEYGNVSPASVGAIQRQLLALEQQGGDQFFGEPALELDDLIQTGPDGRGVLNILVADKLIESPLIYATFLLWLLSELFERLPEVGDLDKPKLVFFFDEAHLLFDNASDALTNKIEQVVRLIRSKGVGVYFVTQNPLDVPDKVLAQLGNRVQHALRAFTPRDQRAVRAAAETFRPNPNVDVQAAITELGVGEALASVLDEKGTPTPVERAFVIPPHGRIGPITAEQRTAIIKGSSIFGHYEKTVDRRSAYEVLKNKQAPDGDPADAEARAKEEEFRRQQEQAKVPPKRSSDSMVGVAWKAFVAFTTSAARSIGTAVARRLNRGIMGTITGGRKRDW